jgi:hypothetical protein
MNTRQEIRLRHFMACTRRYDISGNRDFLVRFPEGGLRIRTSGEFPEDKCCCSFVERLVVITALGGIDT